MRSVPNQGQVVGRHQGAHFFTVGQRKGLQVGGKAEPLFVLAKDVVTNHLYVGQSAEHPGLNRRALFMRERRSALDTGRPRSGSRRVDSPAGLSDFGTDNPCSREPSHGPKMATTSNLNFLRQASPQDNSQHGTMATSASVLA